MVRALILAFALPLAVLAQEPPAKTPADPLVRLLAVLHEKKATSFGDESIKAMTLGAVKDKLEKEFKDDGLRIVIREDLFRLKFAEKEAYSQEQFKIGLYPKDLTVHEFLTLALRDLNAAYVVRRKYLEITTSEAATPLARQVEMLHDRKVSSFGEASIRDMTLGAMKDKLEREFREDGLKIVIREDLFRVQHPDREAYPQEKFKGDLKPKGLTLHEFLTLALADISAVYLVRANHVEVTTPEAAVAECFTNGEKEKSPLVRLRREPLVSHHTTFQRLEEAVQAVSERYGRPVVVDPTADARGEYISANWANVPFPTAIRLLALEAGLDVKETGGVLTITKPSQKKKGK